MKSMNLQFNNCLHKSGFTLLELLVAIIIMTIMAGVGSSMYVGVNERLKIQKAANTLLVTAQYARLSAIEQQTIYKFCIDTSTNEFYLVTTLSDVEAGTVEEVIVEDSMCRPILLENGLIFEDIQILSNEYNLGSSGGLEIIVFTPNGTAQTALIQIGNGKAHYTLSINGVTGKSKIYSTAMDYVPVDTVDLDA